MKTILARLWKEDEGQDLTEYALLLVLVALAAIGRLAAGDSDQQRFHTAATNLSTLRNRAAKLACYQPGRAQEPTGKAQIRCGFSVLRKSFSAARNARVGDRLQR